MLNKIHLLFNTIKYLKAGQILNRIKRKLVKPRVLLFVAPECSDLYRNFTPVIQCPQRLYDHTFFKFLNKGFVLKDSKDWNTESQDKLWLYNLHYFDDLNAVNWQQRTVWHCDLVQKWIDENPLGFGNGWEPYPSSLRIVNWIKWFLLNDTTKQIWLDSLATQTRFLSQNLEYHLLGNHLFANAKALVFAGLFFKGEESDYWYQLGISIIKKELPEQVLSDGGNFELSPMYHAIFLEDLLDLANIHKTYGKSFPDNIVTKILKMLEWLKTMCHPDSQIAFFNDTTLGVAPSFIELLNYSEQLGITYKNHKLNRLTHLEASGYVRLEQSKLVLIADVGNIGPDYIPGHGHADALSFELSLFDKRVIVNSGISTYEIGLDRCEQRGTELHSTVVIDGKNSSQVWSGFRVANRAKVSVIKKFENSKGIEISASHDGYKNLKKGVVHFRNWSVYSNSIKIVDNIIGKGVHNVRSVLPLHPSVLVGDVQGSSICLKVDGNVVKLNFEGNGKLKVIKSKFHQGFGYSINNKRLIYDYNGKLPSRIIIRMSW